MRELRFPNNPEMQKQFEAQERARKKRQDAKNLLLLIPLLILWSPVLLWLKLKKR